MLTGVLSSTVVLINCLHTHGTIIGMHLQYVFIIEREEIYAGTVHLL